MSTVFNKAESIDVSTLSLFNTERGSARPE